MERNTVKWQGCRGSVKLCLSCTNKTFNPEEISGLATSNTNLSTSNKYSERTVIDFSTS